MSELRRLAAGIGIELTPAQLDRFARYERLLVEAKDRAALTAVPSDRIEVDLFFDSLTLLLSEKIAPGLRAIDIGAGAGFPGLPLKLVVPRLELVLLESQAKKTAFLQELVADLGVDAQVVVGRAEAIGRQPGYRETFDLAFARAVAELSVLLEYGLPFLKVGGWFIVPKGPKISRELPAAEVAADALGSRVEEVRPVRVAGYQRERVLVIVKKTSPTPERYPRRPGIPKKRPLGSGR